MPEPQLGDTYTRVLNIATGHEAECCAVTHAAIPTTALVDEETKQAWLRENLESRSEPPAS